MQLDVKCADWKVMIDLGAIEAGKRYSGIRADCEVTVIVIEWPGEASVTVTYRDGEGRLEERVVTADDALNIEKVSSRRWSFDAFPTSPANRFGEMTVGVG